MNVAKKSGISEDKLGIAGLLGLCTVAVIQLVPMTALDIPLWVSLCCFSVVVRYADALDEAKNKHQEQRKHSE